MLLVVMEQQKSSSGRSREALLVREKMFSNFWWL
jgi:hypothetical protein